jgi:CheY-like chemotaxis protein
MEKIAGQSNQCKNPGDCRVILVEDDAMLALVLSSELETAGIKFCAATDGLEALELIRSHRPDVLLLDISMPGLNGFQLIEAIRTDPDLEDLRKMNIVVHTSMELTHEDELRLTLNGKMELITKSKAVDDLATVVLKICSEN